MIPSDRDLNKLAFILRETDRLSQLSARDLVFETLDRANADDMHVTELMNRVMPGWSEAFTEEELES